MRTSGCAVTGEFTYSADHAIYRSARHGSAPAPPATGTPRALFCGLRSRTVNGCCATLNAKPAIHIIGDDPVAMLGPAPGQTFITSYSANKRFATERCLLTGPALSSERRELHFDE